MLLYIDLSECKSEMQIFRIINYIFYLTEQSILAIFQGLITFLYSILNIIYFYIKYYIFILKHISLCQSCTDFNIQY